ncbi:MAG: hypothetical protein E6I36_11840, partial [Chloroflexi bacterium]
MLFFHRCMYRPGSERKAESALRRARKYAPSALAGIPGATQKRVRNSPEASFLKPFSSAMVISGSSRFATSTSPLRRASRRRPGPPMFSILMSSAGRTCSSVIKVVKCEPAISPTPTGTPARSTSRVSFDPGRAKSAKRATPYRSGTNLPIPAPALHTEPTRRPSSRPPFLRRGRASPGALEIRIAGVARDAVRDVAEELGVETFGPVVAFFERDPLVQAHEMRDNANSRGERHRTKLYKMPTEQPVRIDGRSLTLEDVEAVARRGAKVELAAGASARAQSTYELNQRLIRGGATVYGVTTGVGDSVGRKVGVDEASALQESLIRLNGCGTGPELPEDQSRAVVLARANCL